MSILLHQIDKCQISEEKISDILVHQIATKLGILTASG